MIESIIGKRFGKLVVVAKSDKKLRRELLYECICDCGNTTYVSRQVLNCGHKRSCGCLKKEMTTQQLDRLIIDGTRPDKFKSDKPTKRNSTGYKGVVPYHQSGRTKYKAALYYKGVRHIRQGFLTPEAAYKERKEMEKEYLKDILAPDD